MYRWRHGDDWQTRGSRTKNQRCRPRAVSTHCFFLHRDALGAKDFEPGLHEVMNNAVTIMNSVKARATNSRLFTALCEEVRADHHSLFIHTEVRWLSRGRTFPRLFSPREELCIFLSDKRPELSIRCISVVGVSFHVLEAMTIRTVIIV